MRRGRKEKKRRGNNGRIQVYRKVIKEGEKKGRREKLLRSEGKEMRKNRQKRKEKARNT